MANEGGSAFSDLAGGLQSAVGASTAVSGVGLGALAGPIGIIAGVGSFLSSRKKRKQAKKARRRARSIENFFLNIAKQQKELFDKHGVKATERFFAEATEGVNPERFSEQKVADLDRSFNRGLRRRRRQLQSRGLNPGDPAFQAIEDQIRQARAVTEAGLRTSAREEAKDLNLSRLVKATEVGGQLVDRARGAATNPLSSTLHRFDAARQGEQDALEGAGAGIGLALERGDKISNLFRGGSSNPRSLAGGSDLG